MKKGPISPTSDGPFKAQLRTEARASIFYTATTALTQLGNILVVPLFWRALGPADYGVIAITEVVGGVLAVVLGLSLEQTITRYYYEWPEDERARRVGAVWTAHWISTLGVGAIALPGIWLITPHVFPSVSFYPAIVIGVLNSVVANLSVVAQTTLRMIRRPGLYAAYRIATFAIQLAACAYAVLGRQLGVVGYLAALLLSSAVSATVSAILLLRFTTPCLRGAGVGKALRFSIPMIPAGLITALTGNLDRLILSHYAPLATLGTYAIAAKFASAVSIVQSSLKLSYGPFFMKHIQDSVGREMIWRMMGFYIAPLFVAGLSVSLFTQDLVAVAGRRDYYPVAEYVPLLVVAALITSLNVFYANGVILSGRTHYLTYPALVQLGIMGFAVLAVPTLGIAGLIGIKVTSAMAYFTVSVLLSQWLFKLDYNWRRLVWFSISMALAIGFDRLIPQSSLPSSLAVGAASLAGWACVAYVGLRHDLQDNHAPKSV